MYSAVAREESRRKIVCVGGGGVDEKKEKKYLDLLWGWWLNARSFHDEVGRHLGVDRFRSGESDFEKNRKKDKKEA